MRSREEAVEQAMRAALRPDASPQMRARVREYLTALEDPAARQRLAQIRSELMHSPEWRAMLAGAALAATITSSRSVPELYERITPTTTTRPVPNRDERTSEAFFGRHEVLISGVGDLLRQLSHAQWANAGLRMIWRGQQDAAWPVASSLMRDLRGADDAGEDQMVAAEREMIDSAPRWGVSPSPPLHFFADLQHNGAPTRLLDASTDPEVAFWFATEEDETLDERDARVIAWARDPALEQGAQTTPYPPIPEHGDEPFWHSFDTDEQRVEVGWGTGSRTWSWFPAPLNERMRAQRAGFMIEASPIFSSRVLSVFSDALGNDWSASEIGAATTVLGLPSRHDLPAKPNDANIVPVFSFRIAAKAKPAIREYLATKGLTEDRIYPDQSGFVAHLRRTRR